MRRNFFITLILSALAVVMVYLIPSGMTIYDGMSDFQQHSVLCGVIYGIASGIFCIVHQSIPKDERSTVLKVLLWIIWFFFSVLSAALVCMMGMMEWAVPELSNFAFSVPLSGTTAFIATLGICASGYLERKKHSSGAVA